MSSLLTRHAGIQELMDKGELIPDTLVGDSLLDVIFSPDETDGSGLIVDGFPRTALQVDFVKLLHDKMYQLHLQHADSPDGWRFPRTSFKVRHGSPSNNQHSCWTSRLTCRRHMHATGHDVSKSHLVGFVRLDGSSHDHTFEAASICK